MDFEGRAPMEDELPVVVVLRKGDLTREEAEGAVMHGAGRTLHAMFPCVTGCQPFKIWPKRPIAPTRRPSAVNA